MYQSQQLNRLCRNLANSIEEDFSRVGFFFRIFDRVKAQKSTDYKIKTKGANYYDGKTKFIRDIIGIRIVLYFPDDIPILQNRLKKKYNVVEETIDKTDTTNFQPIRINLVCKLPKEFTSEFNDLVQDPIIDTTFEIQLRTVLSEGWHEVDHDLRYKCKDDWKDSNDLSRNFNGILATLETSEYAILRVFDQLSHRHYKSMNIVGMFRSKFRLRLENFNLNSKILDVFEIIVLREFYKIDRIEVITFFLDSNIILPMTLENFILIINYQFIQNETLTILTPQLLLEELKRNAEIK